MNIEHRGISKEVYSTEFRPLVSELYKKCEKYGVPLSLLMVLERNGDNVKTCYTQYAGQKGMLRERTPSGACFVLCWTVAHSTSNIFWDTIISIAADAMGLDITPERSLN